MEENQENDVINENTSNNVKEKVTEFFKSNKKIIRIIVGIIIAIIAIVIIYDVVTLSPSEVVKKMIKQLNSGNSEKAFSYIDWTGYYALSDLDEDDYDDFWDEYQDALDDDDIQDDIDYMLEYMEDYYEEIDDEIKDSDASIKVKEIKKVEKVASHLYLVKAKVQTTDEDGDKDSDTMSFYVMKKGTKSYIVSFGSSISSLLY